APAVVAVSVVAAAVVVMPAPAIVAIVAAPVVAVAVVMAPAVGVGVPARRRAPLGCARDAVVVPARAIVPERPPSVIVVPVIADRERDERDAEHGTAVRDHRRL